MSQVGHIVRNRIGGGEGIRVSPFKVFVSCSHWSGEVCWADGETELVDREPTDQESAHYFAAMLLGETH